MSILSRASKQQNERISAAEARAEQLVSIASALASEVELLAESIPELELALEDREWIRIGNEFDREFSRDAIGKIAKYARLYYLKNPLINRGVELSKLYVWGQGVTISCADDDAQAALLAFFDDAGNARALTGEQARADAEKELRVAGNYFRVSFAPIAGAGPLRVRTIPLEEITDIVCNPQDRSEPWFYKRETIGALDVLSGSIGGTQTTYYPDVDLPESSPARELQEIDGKPIEWSSPIRHRKVGGFSSWRFGVSEVYAALDWARAHKEQLESWSSILLSLKRFAWDQKVRGGAAGISAAKTRIASTVSEYSSETNPPNVAGAHFIHTDGNELKPFKTAGAAPSPEDTRYLLQMVCASLGWPEHFFGNSDVGNYATSKTLDRPSEMAIVERQKLWRDEWLELAHAALAAVGIEIDEDETPIVVEFPPILEHDVDARMSAVVSGITLDGKAPQTITDPREILRLVGGVLAIDDLDKLIDKLYPEGSAPPAVAQQEEALAEALRELAGKLKEITA